MDLLSWLRLSGLAADLAPCAPSLALKALSDLSLLVKVISRLKGSSCTDKGGMRSLAQSASSSSVAGGGVLKPCVSASGGVSDGVAAAVSSVVQELGRVFGFDRDIHSSPLAEPLVAIVEAENASNGYVSVTSDVVIKVWRLVLLFAVCSARRIEHLKVLVKLPGKLQDSLAAIVESAEEDCKKAAGSNTSINASSDVDNSNSNSNSSSTSQPLVTDGQCSGGSTPIVTGQSSSLQSRHVATPQRGGIRGLEGTPSTPGQKLGGCVTPPPGGSTSSLRSGSNSKFSTQKVQVKEECLTQ
eukprot:TRINITY_DN25618_c0_g1_i1.p1 TRINITY_DN25618_c0_g1~~TRINITY_DN25618_c0_g1_i1.p1  ORF type:complete len:309 (-),score=53.55 TRINITY_DN25618_c0_g1_i1:281-1177(-)